jgi:hypothetical protein
MYTYSYISTCIHKDMNTLLQATERALERLDPMEARMEEIG